MALKLVFALFISIALIIVQGLPKPDQDESERVEEIGEFLEGDMILPPGMKAGVIGDSYRWPNHTLVYEIDPTFTEEELSVVMSGLDEISSKTCIIFKVKTSELNFVYIKRGSPNSGCWSWVGRLGGRQELNLQAGIPGCIFKGIVAHELIHALGYFHEQSRTDRDDYVSINWSNIREGTESNFDKYESDYVNPFNVTYDYGSIMHYGPYSFAVNASIPTIIPKEDVEIGQRVGLSEKDAIKLNNMYNCTTTL